MKFAVSMALVVLLLGMPLGCILAAHHASAAHPCCPTTGTNLKCPYDLFDSAKGSSLGFAVLPAPVVSGIAPPNPVVAGDLPFSVAAASGDLYIFNRILRI